MRFLPAIILRRALLSCAVLPLLCAPMTGCTGNWENDSIFFDPRQADVRIAEMWRRLMILRRETDAARSETGRLEGVLRRTRADHRDAGNGLRAAQAELRGLERRLDQLKSRLAAVAEQDAAQAELRRDLERKVEELQRRVASLRARLRTILENQ